MQRRVVCVQLNVSSADRGLGVTMMGRHEQAGGGLFVGVIKAGGLAEQTRLLKTGDQLINVNGIELCGLDNQLALRTVKQQVICHSSLLGRQIGTALAAI